MFANSTPEASGGPLSQLQFKLKQRYQVFIDRITPHHLYRWLFTAFVSLVYVVRVWLLSGFYIVSYALGIYILNLLIGFLSPLTDPEVEGPSLPTLSDDEYRPFARRLPEFKFWLSLTRAVLLSIFATFFKFLNIPVFWPILLIYFIILFVLTMKKQIRHMIRHRYIPFDWGKPKFGKSMKGPGVKPDK